VLNNINSFTLGVKQTNPQAVVQVIFTGEWSLPVREAEAANAFVDAGCDVVTCHVDGPKVVIKTAQKRDVTCGHNASPAPTHSLIVTEQLSIENMTASANGTVEKPGKNVTAKAGFNRAILDTAPGRSSMSCASKRKRLGAR